jgi:two-component system cell cycle sensor histidine kinase/response regulator CckA
MAAIEQAGEIVLVTDTKGIIQYVNPVFEKVTGYSHQEAVGQNPRMLKSGKHDVQFYEDLWTTITAGKTWKGRFINKRKDGKLITGDATISPVYDASGHIVNFVAVKRDITEHLQLEQQLFQAQKIETVGQLASGVAHDYNNMLSVILGYTELTLAKVKPDDPVYPNLTQILKAANRSIGITHQLLTFARKEAVLPQVLDLNEAIEGALKMLRRFVGENIELAWQPGGDLGPVKIDPSQADQLLVNLCINARDAIPGCRRDHH